MNYNWMERNSKVLTKLSDEVLRNIETVHQHDEKWRNWQDQKRLHDLDNRLLIFEKKLKPEFEKLVIGYEQIVGEWNYFNQLSQRRFTDFNTKFLYRIKKSCTIPCDGSFVPNRIGCDNKVPVDQPPRRVPPTIMPLSAPRHTVPTTILPTIPVPRRCGGGGESPYPTPPTEVSSSAIGSSSVIFGINSTSLVPTNTYSRANTTVP